MNEKKRKQKQYYVNQAKRAKFEKRKLHPGLRGFLCTTNNKERECVREAYNLLNEYANQMYGAEHGGQVSFVMKCVCSRDWKTACLIVNHWLRRNGQQLLLH